MTDLIHKVALVNRIQEWLEECKCNLIMGSEYERNVAEGAIEALEPVLAVIEATQLNGGENNEH